MLAREKESERERVATEKGKRQATSNYAAVLRCAFWPVHGGYFPKDL